MQAVRGARERLGLTQRQLAERAGVSRQLVGAVEAGRQEPGVRAALAIASVLGVPVEELFGAARAPGTAVPIWGVEPGPAVVGQVGAVLVHAPVADPVVAGESWAVADAVVGDGDVALLPGGEASGLVVAGCDPALGLAAGLVNRRSGQRLVPVHASTRAAVDALTRGRVHGAVVHGPSGGLPAAPPGVRRWQVACWQVGLAAPPGRRVPSVEEVCGRRVRVVQREEGAGSQGAFERAVRNAGGEPPPGPVGAGHVDVARRVAAGARAGVTMEAAAVALGLGFGPLEIHRVELWLGERWLEEPAAVALCELLGSAGFVRRLQLVGGYDLSGCGRSVGAA